MIEKERGSREREVGSWVKEGEREGWKRRGEKENMRKREKGREKEEEGE